VLVAPEITQTTGWMGRLGVATDTTLHLTEPLGFSLDDKYVRRAGLDYWPHVRLRVHPSWEAFLAARDPGRLLGFAARAVRAYTTVRFAPTDHLVFGGESCGLPGSLRAGLEDDVYPTPIRSPHVRSLNLATAVAIVRYEALRQEEAR